MIRTEKKTKAETKNTVRNREVVTKEKPDLHAESEPETEKSQEAIDQRR